MSKEVVTKVCDGTECQDRESYQIFKAEVKASAVKRLVFEEGAEEVCSIPDGVQIVKIPDSIKDNMYCCGGWDRIEIECSQKIAKKICGSRMDPFSYDPITVVLHVLDGKEMKILIREKLDSECKPHYSLKAKGGKFELAEYDNQLVENTGKFKLKQPEQLLAMVYRLMYPVSLGELHKSVFEEKVIKNKKKLLTTIEGQLDEEQILAFLETLN